MFLQFVPVSSGLTETLPPECVPMFPISIGNRLDDVL